MTVPAWRGAAGSEPGGVGDAPDWVVGGCGLGASAPVAGGGHGPGPLSPTGGASGPTGTPSGEASLIRGMNAV
jgi:hypothetical protein